MRSTSERIPFSHLSHALIDHPRESAFHRLEQDGEPSTGEGGSGDMLVEGDTPLALRKNLPSWRSVSRVGRRPRPHFFMPRGSSFAFAYVIWKGPVELISTTVRPRAVAKWFILAGIVPS